MGNMKPKIGGLIDNKGDLKTELKILKSLGYDYGEFGLGAPEDFIEEYKKNYKGYSHILPISATHLPQINFKKEEVEEIKNFILEHLKIECENFIFHFFTINSPAKDGIPPVKIDILRKLANFTREQKVNLIVENTISVSTEDLDKVFEKVSGIYFCLDTGHANLTDEKNRSIKLLNAFGDKLKHMHAQDNLGGSGEIENDLHLPIGSGNIDFPMIFEKLKQINYSGNITLEVHKFEEKDRKISIDRVRQLLS